MLEIFRDNLCIHCDTSTVPYQGSVNVPIKLTEINGEDLYSEYAVQPKVSYHDGTSWQSVLLPYEDGEFSLPANVFAVNGIKKIAIGLIKEDKEYVTNDLKIIVNSAPTGTLVLPLSPQWNELVDAYLEQRFNQDYIEKFDGLEDAYNTLLVEMKDMLDKADTDVDERWNATYTELVGSLEAAAETYKEIYNQATVEFQPITSAEIQDMFAGNEPEPGEVVPPTVEPEPVPEPEDSGVMEGFDKTKEELIAMVGTNEVVVVDDMEFYVLAEDTEQSAVMIWAKDCVDIPEEVRARSYDGVDCAYFHKRGATTTFWEDSHMRTDVIPAWLETMPSVKVKAVEKTLVTAGMYTNSTSTPTTARDDEGTSDSVYLLSQPEFLDYVGLGDARAAAAYTYWLRSASSTTNVRYVNYTGASFNYASASISYGVRPALWISLE